MATLKDLTYAESLANADFHDFDYGDFTPLEIMPEDMLTERAVPTYSGEEQEIRKSLITGLGEAVVDMTPIVGDVKGAVEYPEDAKLAKQLIEEGYDEGSITKMGLGGGLATLATLGLLPLVGAPADAAKAALKPVARAAAEATTEVAPKTKTGFDKAPKRDETVRVFHGAGTMGKPRDADAERYENLMYRFKTQYIDDPLYDLYKDRETGLITSNFMTVDELVDKEIVGALQVPKGDVDGEVDTLPVKLMKEPDGKLGIYFIDLDTNKLSDEAIYTVSPVTTDGQIAYDQLKSKLRTAAEDFSAPRDIVGERRIDVIKREGFQPFSEFEGEQGLAGFTRGDHQELRKPLLSTSIDPGVSMKPKFGGMDTKNLVYADIPADKIQSMTPEQYNSVKAGFDMPPLEKGKIAYRLPKSEHLEDEIAIPYPELLDVKALSDNPPLEKLVQEQQDKVERIRNNLMAANTGSLENLEDVANQRKAYDLVRSTLTDLQSMGKYAQGQGTGDTYDNFVEELLDLNQYEGFADIVDRLEFALPKGTERHSNMVGIKAVLKELDDSMGGSATFKKREELRHIPDSELRDAVYRQTYKDDDTKMRISESGIVIDDMGDVSLVGLGYKDLKRLLFLGPQKMNKGGLAIK